MEENALVKTIGQNAARHQELFRWRKTPSDL
jgi:hypothetical protein